MLDLTPPRHTLDPIEVASRDEIAAVQFERLRRTLHLVYRNVPFYKQRFDEHGVHPDDLLHLDDLAKFPFTTKDDLRANYPFGMFAVPRQLVTRIHASSGTTGKPTVVGYTKRDVEMWAEVVARSLRASGVRPGDIVHVAYGYGLFTGGLGVHYGAERLGCTVVPVSGGMTPRQVRLITDFEPDGSSSVTPSYMPEPGPRGDPSARAIDSARRLSAGDRHLRGRAVDRRGSAGSSSRMRFGIRRRRHLRPVGGDRPGGGPGVHRDQGRPSTVWEDHFYPEIIDPHSGQVLPDGEMGELVFTSLTKEAMPIIRYRTRDLTRLLPGTARSMRRMEKVTGRSDDMLIIRGVNVFPSQLEELILGQPALAPHYVLEVDRDDRLDTLTVRVEGRRGIEAGTASSDLARAIKDNVGVSVDVVVEAPDTLERSMGKAARVDDRRPPS